MKPQKSIIINFFYNSLLKIMNIAFPLITFPYVARILSPTGIGKVDFSLAVVQYFILISQIGIPLYGVRECSKYRNDKLKLTKTVQEILFINLVMVIVTFALFIVTLYKIEPLQDYKNLLIIMSIIIISSSLGIEWFYQAIEEFRYIAIRSFFVKLFSLILIFLFVKEENDYIIYAIIIMLSLTIGHLYNFIYSHRHIKLFKRFSDYDLKRHVKPLLILFGMSLSVSIYINLDKVMLGLISGDQSVGLYTAANRMILVCLALVTSLGAVLLPRMSYYIKNNYENEARELIGKSIDFILMITIPMVIGIIMLAEPIILLFAGSNYEESITVIRIISPIIIMIGISNLIGVQILIAHGKEKLTLLSTLIGAGLNFLLNLILIPNLQHIGAAISTLLAESIVTVVQVGLAFLYLKGNIQYRNILSYLLGGILIFITCSIVNYFLEDLVLTASFSILISSFLYFILLYLLKNKLLFEVLYRIKSKIHKR